LPSINTRYDPQGSEFSGKVRSILSYGEPYEQSEIVFYHINDSINIKNNRIALTFGGKFSPTKFCAYELNLNSFLEEKKLNICTVRYKNKFFKDLQDENNIDKYDILDKLNLI